MNTKKDLIFLAEQVISWPSDDAATIRLDADGEICFLTTTGSACYDFFPADIDAALQAFVPGSPGSLVGRDYTAEEWTTYLYL